MGALDGAFDEVTEDVEVTINAPAEPGIYNLCVKGTDVLGNIGNPECAYLVVYDPSAGFVTGGGWIDSPGGSYLPDPQVSGKATFGFVSKYKRGKDIPEGQTQFQFKAADVNLHSDSYSWLVVSGAQAQFHGTGLINGVTECTFLVSVTDSAINGGGEVDKFRIKIWAPGIIYANEQELNEIDGDGSIVIHKGKK
jgi:hypothetical protein